GLYDILVTFANVLRFGILLGTADSNAFCRLAGNLDRNGLVDYVDVSIIKISDIFNYKRKAHV
ncbi:hypothetical protein MEO41_27755, partial [Dolichospermum sp. ST_sed4]|nr:hypothetical protein [Dolichospermum sp. ST_sed4]